jgi:CheY-like chemotaxis protein
MPQTLLLADDRVTIQRVIELTFADEAIKVVAVSDGDQAIERIEADPPDIVLVDIGMPGRTGYEVAHHIKQSPRLKHIPVLLLTGAFEPVDQAKAAAAGCDGVLAKPFEPQLVIARVRELLGIGGEGVAPAAAAGERPAPTIPTVPTIPTTPTIPTITGAPGSPLESWGIPSAEAKGDSSSSEQVARLDDYFDQLDAAFHALDGKAPAEEPDGPAAASPVADVTGIIDWFGRAPAPSGQDPDLPLSTAAPEPALEREQTVDVEDAERAEAARKPLAPTVPSDVSEPAPETATMATPEPLPATTEAMPELPAETTAPAPEPPKAMTALIPEPPKATSASTPEPAPAASIPPRFTPLELSLAATTARVVEPSPSPAALPPIAEAFAAILAAEQFEPVPALGAAWPTTAPSNGGGALGEDAIEEITRRVLDRLSDHVVRETVADVISNIAERLVREEIERIKASIK